MKKKTIVMAFILLSIIIIILGIFFAKKNQILKENKLSIIDATYVCDNYHEKFYEDQENIYYFPCTKSTSIYIKYQNGNKYLVVKALEEELVTIDELIDAGLEVITVKK